MLNNGVFFLRIKQIFSVENYCLHDFRADFRTNILHFRKKVVVLYIKQKTAIAFQTECKWRFYIIGDYKILVSK